MVRTDSLNAAPYVAQGLLAAPNPQQLGYEVTFLMVTQKQAGRRPIVDAFVEDLKQAVEISG